MERSLRQSLEMSQGDFSILVTRPISGGLLLIAIFIILSASFKAFNAVRGSDSEI